GDARRGASAGVLPGRPRLRGAPRARRRRLSLPLARRRRSDAADPLAGGARGLARSDAPGARPKRTILARARGRHRSDRRTARPPRRAEPEPRVDAARARPRPPLRRSPHPRAAQNRGSPRRAGPAQRDERALRRLALARDLRDVPRGARRSNRTIRKTGHDARVLRGSWMPIQPPKGSGQIVAVNRPLMELSPASATRPMVTSSSVRDSTTMRPSLAITF